MNPRRLLSVVLACALLFVGAESALASIPHSHGSDFDHSHHGACPVHQLGLHGIDLFTVSPDAPVFTPLVFSVQERARTIVLPCFVHPADSRGPPAV